MRWTHGLIWIIQIKLSQCREGIKMKVIGITGSSGAGKSTVCNILRELYNLKVIDADIVARELSKKGSEYVREIAAEFGGEILDKDGELKRSKLAEIIYADSYKRQKLNNCTFKYIKKEIEEQIQQAKSQNIPIILIDAPLLFECELNYLCDMVIGIISERELQIKRIVARDNISYKQAESRINAQASNQFYIERCDEIIENNNDILFIKKCVEEIMKKHYITETLQ